MAKIRKKDIRKNSDIKIDSSQHTGQDLLDFLSAENAELQQQLQDAQTKASSTISSNISGSVFQIGQNISGFASAAYEGIQNVGQALEDLDKAGTDIMNGFGTARNRLDEFKLVYAEALPSFTEMGISDPAGVIKEVGNALGGAASVGADAIIELGATTQVTGVQAGTLAQNFRDVGMSVYDVADSMKETVDYVKSIGGNVADVSSKVSSSLEKLNMYNFSNGVMGLTKMAAQASRLGVDMNTVFEKSEDLLDPQKAIDMAAGLQRLGVANSEMLDPLRLMDMGLNGPDELMKNMADMSKEFVQLNEKGQFEIMPGAKRRMREVAKELGMSGEEFSKMALKAADFDRKLNEISMPSFVGTQEDKEMIATMAQMKDGKAIIQVKDDKTGQLKDKEVKDLTPADIDKLRLSEEERGKTMEEIALDQLNNLEIIANAQSGVKARTSMAAATAAPVQRAYGYVAGMQRQAVQAIKKTPGGVGDYDYLVQTMNDLTQPMENMAKLFGEGKFDEGAQQMTNLFNTLGKVETDFTNNIQNIVNKLVGADAQLRTTIYGTPVTTPNTTPVTTPNTTPVTSTVTSPQQLTVQTITATDIAPAQIMSTSDVNVNFKLTSDGTTANVDQNLIKSIIEKYFQDRTNVENLFNIDRNGGLRLRK
jgi:hypothetical protein